MAFKLYTWEKQLLEAIHRYGGFVTDEFVDTFFLECRQADEPVPNSNRYIRRRKQLMRQARIIRMVAPDGLKGFVLGVDGARYVASKYGKKLSGKNKFSYRRRQPIYVHHDWREAQTHIRFEEACHQHKRVKLREYRHELELRLFPVVTECYDPDRKEHYTRKIIPDSLVDLDFRMREYSLPIEIDMGTRFDPNIARHKLIPIMFYQRAEKRDYWGRKPSRWLWITTGEVRLRHLKTKIEELAQALHNPLLAHQIVMTTWDKYKVPNIFKEPIWTQAGRSENDYLFACCDYVTNV